MGQGLVEYVLSWGVTVWHTRAILEVEALEAEEYYSTSSEGVEEVPQQQQQPQQPQQQQQPQQPAHSETPLLTKAQAQRGVEIVPAKAMPKPRGQLQVTPRPDAEVRPLPPRVPRPGVAPEPKSQVVRANRPATVAQRAEAAREVTTPDQNMGQYRPPLKRRRTTHERTNADRPPLRRVRQYGPIVPCNLQVHYPLERTEQPRTMQFKVKLLPDEAQAFVGEAIATMMHRDIEGYVENADDSITMHLGEEHIDCTTLAFPDSEQAAALTIPLSRVSRQLGWMCIEGHSRDYNWPFLHFTEVRRELKHMMHEAMRWVRSRCTLSNPAVAFLSAESAFHAVKIFAEPVQPVSIARAAEEIMNILNSRWVTRRSEHGLQVISFYLIPAGAVIDSDDDTDSCSVMIEGGSAARTYSRNYLQVDKNEVLGSYSENEFHGVVIGREQSVTMRSRTFVPVDMSEVYDSYSENAINGEVLVWAKCFNMDELQPLLWLSMTLVACIRCYLLAGIVPLAKECSAFITEHLSNLAAAPVACSWCCVLSMWVWPVGLSVLVSGGARCLLTGKEITIANPEALRRRLATHASVNDVIPRARPAPMDYFADAPWEERQEAENDLRNIRAIFSARLPSLTYWKHLAHTPDRPRELADVPALPRLVQGGSNHLEVFRCALQARDGVCADAQELVNLIEAMLGCNDPSKGVLSLPILYRALTLVDQKLGTWTQAPQLRRDYIRGIFLDLVLLADHYHTGVSVMDNLGTQRLHVPGPTMICMHLDAVSLDCSILGVALVDGRAIAGSQLVVRPSDTISAPVWTSRIHLAVASVLLDNPPGLGGIPGPSSTCIKLEKEHRSLSSTIPWSSETSDDWSISSEDSSASLMVIEVGAGKKRKPDKTRKSSSSS
eukprot:6464546-Amphidinium_carterae.2